MSVQTGQLAVFGPGNTLRIAAAKAQESRSPNLDVLILGGSPRASLALFWHLPQYQRLRSRPEMALLLRRLEGLVRAAYAC